MPASRTPVTANPCSLGQSVVCLYGDLLGNVTSPLLAEFRFNVSFDKREDNI
jgi:hypothetical protein